LKVFKIILFFFTCILSGCWIQFIFLQLHKLFEPSSWFCSYWLCSFKLAFQSGSLLRIELGRILNDFLQLLFADSFFQSAKNLFGLLLNDGSLSVYVIWEIFKELLTDFSLLVMIEHLIDGFDGQLTDRTVDRLC